MKIDLELGDKLGSRLEAVARMRGVSAAALAAAYVEDWLSIEYAELMGRLSRRGIDRDGPIAFDSQAREAARRIEEDLRRIRKS